MEQNTQYLYEYQNGERVRSLGFAKIEHQRDSCRIQVYGKEMDEVKGIVFEKANGETYVGRWEPEKVLIEKVEPEAPVAVKEIQTQEEVEEYIVPMKLDETGLFIKAGAIIPMFSGLLHIEKSKITNLHLYLAPGADEAEYVHYEDDGESLNYQKGEYNEYHFVRNGNKLTMKMNHEGYASTYKKLVVRYGERARGLVFNKEMEIEL